MTENILGVKPLKGGYREWQYKPKSLIIDGTVPIPFGDIIEVSLDALAQELNISVPSKTHSYVHIPIAKNIDINDINDRLIDVYINDKYTKPGADFQIYGEGKDFVYVSLSNKLSVGKYRIKWRIGNHRTAQNIKNAAMVTASLLPPPYFKATFLGIDRTTKNDK